MCIDQIGVLLEQNAQGSGEPSKPQFDVGGIHADDRCARRPAEVERLGGRCGGAHVDSNDARQIAAMGHAVAEFNPEGPLSRSNQVSQGAFEPAGRGMGLQPVCKP